MQLLLVHFSTTQSRIRPRITHFNQMMQTNYPEKAQGKTPPPAFNWHFKNPFTWSSLIPITQTSKDCVFTIHKYAILVLHKLVTRKHHGQWCLTSFLCLRSSLSIKECSLITWPMLSLPRSAPLSCTRQLNLLWSSFLSATSFSTWSFRS